MERERSGLRPHTKKTFFWKKESLAKKTNTSALRALGLPRRHRKKAANPCGLAAL
jgi:hypothetical protein